MDITEVVIQGNDIITIDDVGEKTELALQLKAGIEPELKAMLEKKGYQFDEDPYFWFAEISNDIPNCYDLIFQKPMLKEWTKTLESGVTYQLFHDDTSPIGHSIYGWNENHEGRNRTLGAFYAIPGTQINRHMSSDDFIKNVKGGVLRDVSVGMSPEIIECSICGGDPTDFWGKFFGECDCVHYLGEKYDKDDKIDPNGTKCYGKVPSGYLGEISQVYDGGAPLAGVTQALQMSRSKGLLDARLQARLENRFGVPSIEAKPVANAAPAVVTFGGGSLGGSYRVWTSAGTALPSKESRVADPVATVEVSLKDSLDKRHVDRLFELELFGEGDEFDLGEAMDGLFDTIDTLKDRNKELEADAQVGRSYKTEKIEDMIAAGIRAKGNDFAADLYKAMAAGATIEQIKQLEQDFTAEGDARHAPTNPSRTRLTADNEPIQLDDKRDGKFNDKRYSG